MQARLTPPHLRALILGMALTHGHYYATRCTPVCLANFAFCSCVVLSRHIPRRVFLLLVPRTHKDISLWTFCSHWSKKATIPTPPNPPPPQMFFPLLFPHVELLPPFFFLSFSMVHFVLCKYIQRYQEQDGSSFNDVVQNCSPKKQLKKKKEWITQIFLKTQKGGFFFPI